MENRDTRMLIDDKGVTTDWIYDLFTCGPIESPFSDKSLIHIVGYIGDDIVCAGWRSDDNWLCFECRHGNRRSGNWFCDIIDRLVEIKCDMERDGYRMEITSDTMFNEWIRAEFYNE